MKKIVLLVCLALSGTACHHKINLDPLGLFTNPDGTANVSKILTWIGYGLDADCAAPGTIAQDICSIGKPALDGALAAANKNPQQAAASAASSLQATLNALPANTQSGLSQYFNWGINLLLKFAHG